jgi:hypothetical protein
VFCVLYFFLGVIVVMVSHDTRVAGMVLWCGCDGAGELCVFVWLVGSERECWGGERKGKREERNGRRGYFQGTELTTSLTTGRSSQGGGMDGRNESRNHDVAPPLGACKLPTPLAQLEGIWILRG